MRALSRDSRCRAESDHDGLDW